MGWGGDALEGSGGLGGAQIQPESPQSSCLGDLGAAQASSLLGAGFLGLWGLASGEGAPGEGGREGGGHAATAAFWQPPGVGDPDLSERAPPPS